MKDLQKEIHETAKAKGWWSPSKVEVPREALLMLLDTADRLINDYPNRDTNYYLLQDAIKEINGCLSKRNIGEVIALMHSELSEALEGIRAGNPADDKVPEFNSAEAELADVIIRILDAAEANGWRVIDAVYAKAEMNKGRAYKHGGKAF